MGWMELGWVTGSLTLADLQTRCARGLRSVYARAAGQSTVEYALVGALVVIAAAGALTLLGGELTSVFSRISTTLSGAATPAR
jgi:pilus assembly protein Flp/PilA